MTYSEAWQEAYNRGRLEGIKHMANLQKRLTKAEEERDRYALALSEARRRIEALERRNK